MIVRKLRKRHNWSQEQLAELCGLNVRTIQRIEKGKQASIESLMSIASVFEVDISKLTEDITVIDKKSEEWKNLPLLFRINMFGIGTRRTAICLEVFILLAAFSCWFIAPDNAATPLVFLVAYSQIWLVRYGDEKQIW